MATMQDVAKRAGVALSTVSYAISGTRPIAEETRQRILAAMAELGYQPHALARGLASKRSRIIALLFPAREGGLGMTELEFVTSAADAATAAGYYLVLWSAALREPAELRQALQQGLVDGVVVMEVNLHDARVELLRELELPFTLIGRTADPAGLPFVDIDFDQATDAAVAALADLGHTALALVSHSAATVERGYGLALRAQAGFERACARRGIACAIVTCPDTAQDGHAALQGLLAKRPDITALLIMNDRAIPGVLQAIAERGWQVPADISIISLISSPRVGEMVLPPLTTMAVPSAELGRLGVTHLIHQLEASADPPPQLLLPCQLVAGGSTGPRPTRKERLP